MHNSNTIDLDGKSLTYEQISSFVHNPKMDLKVSSKTQQKIKKSNKFLNENLANQVVYGVNTGFGPMASHLLGKKQVIQLQQNLIRSHAVGIGDPIATEFALAAMIVRLNTIVAGHSGVSLSLVKSLTELINRRIIPVIPEHGAVGTSGDLVQLAHIALTLMGEGEVFYKGNKRKTAEVFRRLKIRPYNLKPKEGLALINGTALMSGVASVLCVRAEHLLDISIRNGAMALELVNAFSDSLSEDLHKLRPHPGQIEVAARMRAVLRDSKLLKNRKNFYSGIEFKDDVLQVPEMVQEVYSMRCIPQILGPVLDTLAMVESRVTTEINSVTDNPVINLEKNEFIHGGNFHGDYISASMDQLKMTLVKMTMLSERRLNFFLNQSINKFLPPFMNLKKPGLTLGLQGLQFVATSTTSQSQTLSFPQYVHSIPTNGDNQDIVSMGTDSALMVSKVIENAFIVLAIESLALSQAADFLGVLDQFSKSSLEMYKQVRKSVPSIVDDRYLTLELASLVESFTRPYAS